MLNLYELQNSMVDKLRAIPDLVDLVGDIAEITMYGDESQISGNPETAEFSMMGRAVMVIWTGSELPRTGETRGWKHSFRIALKAESIQTYYALAQAIFDGVPDVPAGDGCNNFLNCDIPGTDGIQEAIIEPVRSADGVGRLQITFSLYER